jgi:hypothetical protein
VGITVCFAVTCSHPISAVTVPLA